MKYIQLFLSFVFLTVISVLLSGNLKAQTTITSSITITQAWVDANALASERVISGNNITVTFGQNLTITPPVSSIQTFFKITGTNVVIDGANKIVTLAGTNMFNGLVDASNPNASTAIIKNIGIAVSDPSTFQMNSSTGYISTWDNRAAIQNCYSNGLIYQSSMGGIVGYNNYGMISNCYSTGAISGSSAGGIVGSNNTVSGTIQNCYSTGAISGTNAGGIAGNSNDASIQNAYSFGSITGTGNIGTISKTYNTYTEPGDGTWNSTAANAALTGLGSVWNTTTLMPTINSYTLYDLILTSINLTSPIAILTSCLGTASSSTTFGVTGSGLTVSITISAPSNFEISTSSGGTYSSSLTLTNTNTISQTLYVRLNSSATAGAKTGNITATSTGVTDVTTTVSGTVNVLPNISFSGSITNVELVSLTANAFEGAGYSWSGGTSTNTVSNTFDASGLYSLAVSDINGCISSTLLNITVQHWGLSRNGEKTLDSAIQINANGKIGSLTPLSQDGKRREYKQKVNLVSHYIGEPYGGGIVFYLTDGGAHGLIAATTDQGSSPWGCQGTTISGAVSTAIGSGAANTAAILAGCATRPIAASIANDYSDGIYTDWYLPSKDELNLMYINIGKGASPSSPNYDIGVFANNYYWSSTEFDYNYAWFQSFTFGFQSNFFKSSTSYVRAIRSF
jgi:hypothetical protein